MNFNSLLFLCILSIFSCRGEAQKSSERSSGQADSVILGDTVSGIDGEIRCIFQDSKNNLWIASNGDGVFKYDGHTTVRFTEKHVLPGNFVWNVQESKDGHIWFKMNIRPTDASAFCRFDGSTFTSIPIDTNNNQTIDYDYRNDELFAEYYYKGKAFVKIQPPHTSPLKNEGNARHHYDIYATCKDRNGNLWIGTCTAGVCRYDGKTYTWLDDKALGTPVRAIFEDKNGIIWIGTNGNGLFRYDGKTLVNFSKEHKLENPDLEKYPTGKEGTLSRVWSITEDKQGNLWAGTIDNGAWMFDGKSMSNYSGKNAPGLDFIWTIYKDNAGRLWFGTDGAGVYMFDGDSFVKFEGK